MNLKGPRSRSPVVLEVVLFSSLIGSAMAFVFLVFGMLGFEHVAFAGVEQALELKDGRSPSSRISTAAVLDDPFLFKPQQEAMQQANEQQKTGNPCP